MKRYVGVVLAALFLMLGVSGCSTSAEDWTSVFVKQVSLPDGRVVNCVVSDGSYSGGVDCDWENAR